VISFAEPPAEPGFRFGGDRVQVLDDGAWKLVYATKD